MIVVLAEPETTQATLDQTPEKVLTPLQVAPPESVVAQGVLESPITPVLQIDERAKNAVGFPAVNPESITTSDRQKESVTVETPLAQNTLCPRMDPNSGAIIGGDETVAPQAIVGAYSIPHEAETPTFQFRRYHPPTTLNRSTLEDPTLLSNEDLFDTDAMELQGLDEPGATTHEFPEVGYHNLNITRQEIMTLTSVLGRIPHDFLSGEGMQPDQPLSLTVVDDVLQPTLATTSSQEDQSGPSSSRAVTTDEQQSRDLHQGKRRRPKYSLKVGMLKKHPVLKFSATGPLDADKTPYKWWCRVCRTELSLMSRGPLELISHYRTDSHLVKEHRMRMEIPGMPLFDKDEKEILGIALQDAKRVAKDTHPIAPQLDSCHPLVGQATVPAPSAVASPTEKILFQIGILEFGLKFGGHINNLTGIYGELSRMTSFDALTSQNRSEQRLYVSILTLSSTCKVNFLSYIV